MEILITFDSTTAAISAEKALMDAGIAVRVMNLPSSIRAGCGISLRVEPGDAALASQILKENKLDAGELFQRTIDKGRSQYKPYTEGST